MWLALLFAVLAGIAGRDLAYLLASPFPYGVDGYYYVAQVKGLQTHGSLLRGAPPLTFLCLQGISLFCSPTLAVKLGGVLFHLGFGLLSFFLIRRLTGSSALGLLACVIGMHSFLWVDLIINFLKQSFGHIWVLGAMAFIAVPRGSRRWKMALGAAACLVGAAFTHGLALALVVLLLAAFAALRALERIVPRRRFLSFHLCAVVALWGAGWGAAACGPCFPERIRPFLESLFQSAPRLNLDSVYDSLDGGFGWIPLALILTVLLWLSAGIVILRGLAFDAGKRRGEESDSHAAQLCEIGAVAVCLMWLAYSPFLTSALDNRMSLSPRLLASQSIPAAILIPVAAALAPIPKKAGTAAALAASGLFLFSPVYWQGFSGPPADRGRLHLAMEATKGEIPEDAVIVTGLRLGNMVNAIWGKPCYWNQYAMLPPEGNCYRLAFVDFPPFDDIGEFCEATPPHARPLTIIGPWVLLKEETYREYVERLKSADPERHRLLVVLNDGT